MTASDPTTGDGRNDGTRVTMRAVAQDRYGSPRDLEIREVPRPSPNRLSDGQVLVRVVAASLNALDHHFMTGLPLMMRPSVGLLRPPPIRGADLAGVVEATGPGVDGLAVGDRVFGTASGSLAEYVVTKAARLCRIPVGPSGAGSKVESETLAGAGSETLAEAGSETLTDAEAAALPVAGITALEAVRDHGGVRTGSRVLVIGAAGGVGTYAVQIAVALGAEVTGVCSSRNVDLVRALGARRVIDYTATDPEEEARLDGPFDVIVDNVGSWSLRTCAQLLAGRADGPGDGGGTGDGGGIYVMVSGPKHRVLGPVRRMLAGMVRFRLARRRFKVFVANESSEKLADLARLVETGQVQPVIERRYDFEDSIEAIEHLATGHARAKLVVDVAGSDAGAIELPERARIDGLVGHPLP